LKREYGHADDSKEWAGTVKGHLAKWKLIKKQSAKAAGSGRQGGGPVKKQQYSWRLVAEVKGNELSLGTFWTNEEAAKRFKTGYEWQNNPSSRSGNVSIQSVWYKCRKYISDSAEEGRIRPHLRPHRGARRRDAAWDTVQDRAGLSHRRRRRRRRQRWPMRWPAEGCVGRRRAGTGRQTAKRSQQEGCCRPRGGPCTRGCP
jgi:hypothetical protein